MQKVFRANLGAVSFPFLSQNFGRSIILRQFDQNFVDNITSREDLDRDVGVPQAYYLENVLPMEQGLASIGYTKVVGALSTTEQNFRKRFEIRDGNDVKLVLGITTDGRMLVAVEPLFSWVEVTVPVAIGTKEVYVATVSGATYIYIERTGCYLYDFTTNTLIATPLAGLSFPDIIGITSAKGYLIAWSSSEVAWSSTIDPTDFVPSLITNAGGGAIEDRKGKITFCAPHNLGFIVYTTTNAIGANYSGNPRFPFSFNEISGAGGCPNIDALAIEATEGNHWIFGTAGLQLVNMKLGSQQFPAVTDFINNSRIETFNPLTKEITTTVLAEPMVRKISLVAKRYLIISYGDGELTQSIVYDTGLKRFGKLVIDHVECFSWTYDPIKTSIAFLQKDGTVMIVNEDVDKEKGLGVLLLGKYQHVRTRLIQLQQVDIENIPKPSDFTLSCLSTVDGKTPQVSVGFLNSTASQCSRYLFSAVGINISLLLEGNFNIHSLVLYYNDHGRR